MPGESQYDDLERRLAAGPPVTAPALTIESDFDGAAADGKGYAGKFTGPYAHRVLNEVGHDVPQDSPREFAQTVVDVRHLSTRSTP